MKVYTSFFSIYVLHLLIEILLFFGSPTFGEIISVNYFFPANL